MTIDNNNYQVDIENMRGDFLINNTLERFTYVYMGKTEIIVNGKKYAANYVLNMKASINYGKLLPVRIKFSKHLM